MKKAGITVYKGYAFLFHLQVWSFVSGLKANLGPARFRKLRENARKVTKVPNPTKLTTPELQAETPTYSVLLKLLFPLPTALTGCG